MKCRMRRTLYVLSTFVLAFFIAPHIHLPLFQRINEPSPSQTSVHISLSADIFTLKPERHNLRDGSSQDAGRVEASERQTPAKKNKKKYSAGLKSKTQNKPSFMDELNVSKMKTPDSHQLKNPEDTDVLKNKNFFESESGKVVLRRERDHRTVNSEIALVANRTILDSGQRVRGKAFKGPSLSQHDPQIRRPDTTDMMGHRDTRLIKNPALIQDTKGSHTGYLPPSATRPRTRSRSRDVASVISDTSRHRVTRVKYLIYLCDRGRSCGGWGDRQRGLASAFLLAYVTNRRFGVNMTLPCDVINYYVPNDVNWRVSEEDIRGKSSRVINSVGNNSFHESLVKIDFNVAYPEDVIFLRTNVEHYWAIRSNPRFRKVLPVWAQHGRSRFFREAWNILMKPATHLQSDLDRLLQDCHFVNRTNPFVCAHVRIGRSKSNPKDSELRNDVTKLGSLWTFLEFYVRNGSHVFVATDSTDVREMSREKFKYFHHDTGGKILHIDKQRQQSDACQGFESALLDQLVLTRCDVLVTSNSMFSSRAALVRGSNDGLYYFDKGAIRKVKLG